uniref:Ankycorbin-like n=1 Tax=Phallusia mammillata TaxID=59560 RepID=A0A6F9DR87_9ASCI|nr:ankycorbin-like [Phallusia mammillata]
MRSIKAKLKKPANSVPSNKDDWSKLDQRVWHSVAVNHPVKLASKLSKHENINVNKISPDVGYSVVHYAAAKGLDDCLNVLLAHKANVSTRDVTGATPLHASARYGHKGTTTKLLASRTVDVNARDNNCCTALHFAAFEGHLDCLRLIADEKGSDIHCVDKEGRTSLMVAAAMGRLPVCTELIRRGVDVNHKDSSDLQHTALTLAAEAGHADVVRLLCENGADHDTKLLDGRNALDVARGRSRKSVIDALHIMQLTEAAKKNDKGPRLSTSTKPNEKIDERQMQRKSVADVFVPSGDEGSVRSLPTKQHDGATRGHVYKHKPDLSNSGVLSLYNDSKNFSNLYERDVHMYDSKSTLASISSIDVTGDSQTNRSYVTADTSMTSPPSAPPSVDLRRQIARLSDELKERDEMVNSLQAEVKEFKAIVGEMEALKMSYRKAEIVAKDLEKDNKSLASKRKQLHDNNELLTTRVHKLQKELEKTNQNESNTRQKLADREKEINEANSRISELAEENKRLAEANNTQSAKLSALNASMLNLLTEVDQPSDSTDSQTNFNAISLLLLKTLKEHKNRQKKSAIEEEQKKVELEKLQRRLREREDEVEDLSARVAKSQTSLGKCQEENDKLVVTLRNETERLDEFETLHKKQAQAIDSLTRENARLQLQLAGSEESATLIQDLQEKILWYMDANQRLEEEVSKERKRREEGEKMILNDVTMITAQYNESEKSKAELEKALSEMRSERNQREAKITRLDEELQRAENRRNESEVECNRARQQLTEAKRESSKLQEEVSSLRRSKKELSTQLGSLKIYGFNDAERKRIDSMQKQLDHLCKHIQSSEEDYNHTIAIYRSHLLKAAEGELNAEVLTELKGILKLLGQPHSSQDP